MKFLKQILDDKKKEENNSGLYYQLGEFMKHNDV